MTSVGCRGARELSADVGAGGVGFVLRDDEQAAAMIVATTQRPMSLTALPVRVPASSRRDSSRSSAKRQLST